MRKLRHRGTKYHTHVTQLGSGGLCIQTQTGLHFMFLFEQTHFFFFFLWPHYTVCGILVPGLGIEPRASVLKAQSPNHWTTREFRRLTF